MLSHAEAKCELNKWQVLQNAKCLTNVRKVSEFGHDIEFVRTFRYCLSLELL